MCAICDVNEYRKCVRLLNCPQVTQLFDILHALCNLLLVKHENLQEVCGGETLVRTMQIICRWLAYQILCIAELPGETGGAEFHSIAKRL